MSDQNLQSAPNPAAAIELTRQSQVTTTPIKVRLNQIVEIPERYCLREESAFSDEPFKMLMESLRKERLQVPLEVYRDQQGRHVLLKGHRRKRALEELARKNTLNFASDMEIDALEVHNFTPQDLAARAISDNLIRLNLDRLGRIRAAKILFDSGMEESRAAATLGISVKTYQRDMLIAKHSWMLQHIIDNSIDPNAACELLEAAEKAKRVSEVKEDLDAWIAAAKKAIRDKEKLQKAEGGKAFSDTEKQVKRQMPDHLRKHWKLLIEQEARFDDDVEWEYKGHLDKEKKTLHVPGINLDLDKGTPEQIAKVAAKLSLLSKQLKPFVQRRFSDVAPTGVTVEPDYDMEYLDKNGAGKLAEYLKQRHEEATAPDGEAAAPSEPTERTETDLAATVELPPATERGAASPPPTTDGARPASPPPAAGPSPSPVV